MPVALCDVSTLEKSCRLCLSQSGVLSPIFQDAPEDTGLFSLPAKIVACVDVEVTKEDNLPQQICHRCLYQVERSYDFKEQCKKTERLLQEFLSSNHGPEKDTSDTPETLEVVATLSTKATGEKSNVVFEQENHLEENEEEMEENDHEMVFAEGDECGDDDEEVSEADKALVESLAKCPDLKVVQPPCDSSIKGLCLDVDNKSDAQRQCHLCDSSFLSQQHLWTHLINHNTNGPPFSCLVCVQTFDQRMVLEEHWKSHIDETPFSCLLCDSICASSERLEEHVKSHRSAFPYNCSDCDETFASSSDLRKHALVHAGLRPFKCQVCPKEFSRTTNLNKHMRVHSGQRPYSCGECPKMFRTRGDMLRHSIIHTGQKPFSCSVCMISFNRKDKLTRHERLHLTEKPFSCSFCSMAFLRRDDLSKHSLIHLTVTPKEEHEQETATDLSITGTQQLERLKEDETSCDGEGRLTIVEDEERQESDEHAEASDVDSAQPNGHVDVGTSSQVESMVISVDPFHVNSSAQSASTACDSSTWPQNLSVNKKRQESTPRDDAKISAKPYTCDICNKKFSDKSYMKTHQLTHFGVRPHACGYCGKAFFRRRELLRHEAVHTGVKPFTCKICQKAFARSDKLMRHERTHGNAQQHPCSYCPAKFVRKDDLTRHEMTHTGLKPHSCSSCAKSFTTKAELTRHEKTHVTKEFKCEICPQTFSRKDRLVAHVKTHEAAEHVEHAEMPLVENVSLRSLMAQCSRFGNEPRDHVNGVSKRTLPILSQGSEFHLVPLKQN